MLTIKHASMVNSGKNKILLVDDEPINIRQIGHLLEPDYDIIVATSGQQALDIASSEPQPDLILLDVVMPLMDGHEVCRQLKSNSKTIHIPIIFLTANHKEEDEAQGLELGAVDYIIKPFRPLVDLKRIKTHITLHEDKKYFLRQFVDTLPFSTFVVGENLSIKSYNQLSQQLLDTAHSDFSIHNNKLVYTRQASLFPDLIDNVKNYDKAGSHNNSENIIIVKSPTQNYRIFITPLNYQNNNDDEDAPETRQYVIYINKYNDFLKIEVQLKEIYDLTTAEARLANGIINGLTLEEIAEKDELKYSTLKSYLKIIFQKTGTKKQHELVSAILRNFTCSM